MANDIEGALKNFPIEELPALSGRLKTLRGYALPEGGGNVTAVSLDALERWRTHTPKLASSAPNATEATALRPMVTTYADGQERQRKQALPSDVPEAKQEAGREGEG